MSDTKATSPAKSSKSDSASKAKSDSTKTDSAKSNSKTDSAAKSDSSKSDSGSKSEGGGAGKSARESVGGAKDVHYGYFSNVKSPEYLDGWDAIWGKKKGGAKKKASATKKPASRKPLTPVRVNVALDDLPAEVRDGLVKVAKTKLKKSRVNYDKRDAAGGVDWQIECWVKRV